MHSNDKFQFSDTTFIELGNTARGKIVIEKLNSNLPVTIVFLGGSITEAPVVKKVDSFISLFTNYLQKKFPENNKINIYNLGISGTDSICGLLRTERDVLKYNPDLVFLDYSVNDRKDSLYQKCFESMVAKILIAERNIDVVLLLFTTQVNYSCEGHMKKIGRHYQIPIINIGQAIKTQQENNRMIWSDYSDDTAHPNKSGNLFINQCLCMYFEQLINAGKDILIPPAKISSIYGNEFKNLSIHECTYPYWKGIYETELTFQSLFIMFSDNNDPTAATVNIFIDDKKHKMIEGYHINGYERPLVILAADKLEYKSHLIKITNIEADKGKTFSLICLGIC